MRKQWISGALAFSIAAMASAQNDTLHIPSMEEVYKRNDGLEGTNPAGLAFNCFRSFSLAKMEYSHRNGNLGNAAIPVSADIYSVESESFQHLDNLSLYGKIAYTQFQNRKQNWNGMTGDYWQTVNLCDSVSGKQQSEQYRLAVAFSLPLPSHWLVGGQADYEVRLTAKDTDPRNKNQWMKGRFTPGIAYRKKNFRLGTSFFYSRQKETVDYKNKGNHTTYPVLVSYPLGFFKTLAWGDKVNWYYTGWEAGAALQSDIRHHSFQFFQEMSGTTSQQTVESNRIQNRKESESTGWQVMYKGKFQQASSFVRHEWKWQVVFDGAHVYDPLQHQDKSGMWVMDGKSLRSTRHTRCYALTYGYYQLRDIWHPRLSLLSGILYRKTETELFFYPLEYSQPLYRVTVHTTFVRNFLLKKACLDVSIGARFEKGGGSVMKEKRLPADENGPEITLWQHDGRLQQLFDYETMPRWAVETSLTYTRNFSPFRAFIQLSFDFEKTSKNKVNSDYQKIKAHLGLLF